MVLAGQRDGVGEPETLTGFGGMGCVSAIPGCAREARDPGLWSVTPLASGEVERCGVDAEPWGRGRQAVFRSRFAAADIEKVSPWRKHVDREDVLEDFYAAEDDLIRSDTGRRPVPPAAGRVALPAATNWQLDRCLHL